MNTDKNPSRIIAQCLASTSQSIQTILLVNSALKRTINRVRRGTIVSRDIPTSFEELIVPEDMQVTQKKERFLLYDSGNDDNKRILIFSTYYNLSIMSKKKFWSGDGTFDLCPGLFGQIYTLYVLYKKNVYLVFIVYCLINHKKHTIDYLKY